MIPSLTGGSIGRSTLVFILVLIALLSSCILGVEGDDTIRARDAAGDLNQAMAARQLVCRESVTDSVESTTFLQPPCVGATDGDRFLMKVDVQDCVNTLLYWPCPDTASGLSTMTFAMNQTAINCPARTVPFLFNDASPPIQGHILSIASSDYETGGVFYFACF